MRLITISLAALMALSLPASAQQSEAQQQLTQCGAVGLMIQSLSSNPAREGNPTAQISYSVGYGLYVTSIRLLGEVTECAGSFEEVHGDVLASATSLQGVLREMQGSGSTPGEIMEELMGTRAQCTATFGFDVMRSAQIRIAQEGLGCGWQPGAE